jgi:hypothetical protein
MAKQFTYFHRIEKHDSDIIGALIGKKGATIKQFQYDNRCWVANCTEEDTGTIVFKITTHSNEQKIFVALQFLKIVLRETSKSKKYLLKGKEQDEDSSGGGSKAEEASDGK